MSKWSSVKQLVSPERTAAMVALNRRFIHCADEVSATEPEIACLGLAMATSSAQCAGVTFEQFLRLVKESWEA